MYLLVCFSFLHQHVSSVSGQDLYFGRCGITGAEKSAWHTGSARGCLLHEGISLQPRLETVAEGQVPGLSNS